MILTKSKYIAGVQCPRYLWTLMHDKDKIPPLNKVDKFRMDEGTEVGELATQLFPEGISVPFKGFRENIDQTKELLNKKKPLFEAGITYENCFSRADILVPVGDQWDIVEVKGGTKVKDINLHDVAFQKYCYEGAGLKIRKCFLLHLNSYYIRKGKINIKKLFVKDDITEQVKDLENETKVNILALSETINSKKYPEATIGPRCKSPYQCPLTECWDFLPENHVFHLYRGGKKSLDLFESGVHAIHEIPEDTKLTDRQGIQKKCEDSGEIHIDKKNIKRFLDGLKYPLYYLDFETFSTAVPMFDGSKTYQNIPFQYSLHVVEKEGAKPKHFEYLYSGKGDPRKDFISNLVKVMGQTGSVIVYNESFEIGRLKELSLEFPQHSKDIINIIGRVVDLLTPFRNFHYYNPKQKGSASIKKVLPALTEGKKGYEGMDIADGAVASVEYYYMTYKNGKDVRESLLEYCGLDTMAEVWIVGKLKEVL